MRIYACSQAGGCPRCFQPLEYGKNLERIVCPHCEAVLMVSVFNLTASAEESHG